MRPCRSLGPIQPVWRPVGLHRQQGRQEEAGWTPSSISFLAASRRPPMSPMRMPSSAPMTTSGHLYCCVTQKDSYMCHAEAITAKQPDCCLFCITLAATVADSVIQHSDTDPSSLEAAATGMLTVVAAAGRRQRVQLSLRLLRERRYDQCWMCPGHLCWALSVCYLKSSVQVI